MAKQKSTKPLTKNGKFGTNQLAGSEKNWTPEKVEAAIDKYIIWSLDNPILQEVANMRTGDTILVSHKRPLNIFRFELYLKTNGYSPFRHYIEGGVSRYPEFASVVEYLQSNINAEMIEGGLVGIFNANIVARLMALIDRQDVTTKGEAIDMPVPVFTLNK